MNTHMYMMPNHYLPREQTSYNPNDSRLFFGRPFGFGFGAPFLDPLDHLVLVCHLDSDLACRFLEGSHFSYN